jgi:hypothetical protein
VNSSGFSATDLFHVDTSPTSQVVPYHHLLVAALRFGIALILPMKTEQAGLTPGSFLDDPFGLYFSKAFIFSYFSWSPFLA